MICNHDDVWVTQHDDRITWEWKGTTGYALVQREVLEVLLARCNEPTYAAGVQAARDAVDACEVVELVSYPHVGDLPTIWLHEARNAIDALRSDRG